MINLFNNILKSKYILIILLSIHFLINLGIYFNTNTFYEISESGSVYEAYYSLIRGESILPVDGYYFLTTGFIAYFINNIAGNDLFFYFIFQLIISTLTVYIVYSLIFKITNSQMQAALSIILMIFYLEYNLLGSIFYNQLYEVFFVSVFLLLSVYLNDEKKIKSIIIYSLLILLTLFFSMFFRKTLQLIYVVFIFLLLFNFKDKTNFTKFALAALSCFFLLYFFNPYKMFNSDYKDESETLFWGHTFYGGLGGENGFIFPENERRYNERFIEYLKINKIDSVNLDVIKKFRISEVKYSIFNKPHMWLFLQAKKVFYTFGSVPQKDGLLMLYKGKIKIPWYVSAFLLQLSYAVILIMFLITVDLNLKKILYDKYKRIIYFLGLYLIGGICIFSAYQERYRPVIFICFFIPVIAINFSKLNTILLRENRRELIIRLIFIIALLAVWIYQAYEALYIYHDRYFKVVQ